MSAHPEVAALRAAVAPHARGLDFWVRICGPGHMWAGVVGSHTQRERAQLFHALEAAGYAPVFMGNPGSAGKNIIDVFQGPTP